MSTRVPSRRSRRSSQATGDSDRSADPTTCVEATVRYAAELGYQVTMVKDATTSYSDEHMHAALDINIPNYATAIVGTDETVDAISSLVLGADPHP